MMIVVGSILIFLFSIFGGIYEGDIKVAFLFHEKDKIIERVFIDKAKQYPGLKPYFFYSQGDIKKEYAIIKKIVQENFDFLVVYPAHHKMSARALELAKSSGMNVILLEKFVYGIDADLLIQPDFFLAGIIAGNQALKLTPEKIFLFADIKQKGSQELKSLLSGILHVLNSRKKSIFFEVKYLDRKGESANLKTEINKNIAIIISSGDILERALPIKTNNKIIGLGYRHKLCGLIKRKFVYTAITEDIEKVSSIILHVIQKISKREKIKFDKVIENENYSVKTILIKPQTTHNCSK